MLFLDSFNFEQQEQIKKSTLTQGGEENLRKLLILESPSYNQVQVIINYIGDDVVPLAGDEDLSPKEFADQAFPLLNLIDAIIERWDMEPTEDYDPGIGNL